MVRIAGARHQLVVEPLVVPLAMIVLEVLGDHETEVTVTQGTRRFRHSSLIDRTKRSACVDRTKRSA